MVCLPAGKAFQLGSKRSTEERPWAESIATSAFTLQRPSNGQSTRWL